jgi:hypothetical protein
VAQGGCREIDVFLDLSRSGPFRIALNDEPEDG